MDYQLEMPLFAVVVGVFYCAAVLINDVRIAGLVEQPRRCDRKASRRWSGLDRRSAERRCRPALARVAQSSCGVVADVCVSRGV